MDRANNKKTRTRWRCYTMDPRNIILLKRRGTCSLRERKGVVTPGRLNAHYAKEKAHRLMRDEVGLAGSGLRTTPTVAPAAASVARHLSAWRYGSSECTPPKCFWRTAMFSASGWADLCTDFIHLSREAISASFSGASLDKVGGGNSPSKRGTGWWSDLWLGCNTTQQVWAASRVGTR